MATQVPPKKNTAFVFYVSLISQASRPQFQASATLAAGDVKVSIDDGAPANLTTLPAVDADFTKRVKVSLSADEMNGDVISVIFSDAAGDEWDDLYIEIHTSTDQIDDLALSSEITTLSSAIAALNDITAAEVWAATTRTLTQGAAAVAAAVDGSDITVYRGTTWSVSVTGLGDITTYDKVYLTVKRKGRWLDPDSSAILQVTTDTDGLLYFNGSAPATASDGTIARDSDTDGNVTVTVLENVTLDAPIGTFAYDFKGVDADGSVVELSAGGTFTIAGDVTRATT